MIPYEIVRSQRKTVSLQVTQEGKVLVRCPRRLPLRQVQRFVQEHENWLEAQLTKIAAQPKLPKLTEEERKSLVSQAAQEIPRLAEFYAPLVGVSYGRITIRSQRGRWGSCSGAGNLNFNCLLMLTPPQVREYVVVHELCHRKEMNHSAQFWAEVERILPDYRQRRQWLKDQGGALIARLPGKEDA